MICVLELHQIETNIEDAFFEFGNMIIDEMLCKHFLVGNAFQHFLKTTLCLAYHFSALQIFRLPLLQSRIEHDTNSPGAPRQFVSFFIRGGMSARS